jgi:DNA-directed RNA polymerase subunit M/transcription elongation factor TFIIS
MSVGKLIPPSSDGRVPVMIKNAVARFPNFSIYKTEQRWCEHSKDILELVAIITARRTKQYRLRCTTCGYSNTFNIAYKLLAFAERDDARIVRVNAENTEPISPGICEICGFAGYVEEHHWAPRAIFGEEAYEWPTSMLCLKCHVHWHQMMAR